MSFELKNGAAVEGLPTITLGDQVLYIPRSTLRQNLVMVALAPKIDAVMNKVAKFVAAAASGEPAPEIDPAEFDPMLEAIRNALSTLYPSLTLDDLRDLETDLFELKAAIPVISAQASSRRKPPGETMAASPSAKPTGESSSPTSSSS